MFRMLVTWVGRLIIGLVLLLAIVVAGGYFYLRSTGAGVNTPVAGALASLAPALFDPPAADPAVLMSRLRLPDGFSLSVFAQGIPGARMLRTTRSGDLLVAAPGRGQVLLLVRDANGDGAADGSRTLLTGLASPNGLDFHDGYLYVAEDGQVGRAPFDHERGVVTGPYEVVIPDLPAGGNHYKKTIRFGPDGMLYLAVGSSCNVCIESDARRAALWRYAPDGSGGALYAGGLRNSAGFDWRPSDGALFATDNGRDLLGDDVPPCELNLIEAGGFYGWPFVNGFGVLDPDYGESDEANVSGARDPAFGFAAHNAPLGILFPSGESLPEAYQNAALVALHGSWNRTAKDGYKVVSLHWAADGSVEARDFISGFLEDDGVIGRPAELAEGQDGSIFISDDFAGAVYRVVYGEGSGAQPGVGLIVGETGEAEVLASGAESGPIALGEQLFREGACLECHTDIPPTATAVRRDAIADRGPGASDGEAKVSLASLGQRYGLTTLNDYLARPTPPMPPVDDAGSRAALAEFLLDRFR